MSPLVTAANRDNNGGGNDKDREDTASEEDHDDEREDTTTSINLVPTSSIQRFTFLYKGRQTQLAIDSGAEGDYD